MFKVNKGLLTVLAVAALGMSKSAKGSQARSVFDSKKAQQRFKDLNGYELDSLVDLMLDAYVQQFMNLDPFYDYLKQHTIDYKDRPYFTAPMFSTNLGITSAMLDSIGVQYIEAKRSPGQPDWYHFYGIIVKNLMGSDILIQASIQEDRKNKDPIESKVDDKNNKLIQECFDGDEEGGIDTFTMETLENFVKTSMFLNKFFSELIGGFHVTQLTPDKYRFLSVFIFLKKDLYLKIKDLLVSNKMAMDIFKSAARSSFKHELIHVVEIGYNWKVVSPEKHGLKNYMSSRIERRTWGQNVVDEVNFRLDTLRKAEELFPEETVDVFFSPYREEKFLFNVGSLEQFLRLNSIKQYLSNDDLLGKTLEWISLPKNKEKFSNSRTTDDFILKTFPVLKGKPFQHWRKMVQTSIKDMSSGTVSFIGGKGANPESYKKCLKEFFDRCSRKGKIKPKICVVTSASKEKDAGVYEANTFREMGASVEVIQNCTNLINKLSGDKDFFQGIFFTGGDQGRLMREIKWSKLSGLLKEAHKKGVHIGGTSAGAAILSEKIIISGESEPVIGDGLGLIKKYIVDQHFSSRNRKGRLKEAIKNTGLRGLGVDEDSMIMVFDDGL